MKLNLCKKKENLLLHWKEARWVDNKFNDQINK